MLPITLRGYARLASVETNTLDTHLSVCVCVCVCITNIGISVWRWGVGWSMGVYYSMALSLSFDLSLTLSLFLSLFFSPFISLSLLGHADFWIFDHPWNYMCYWKLIMGKQYWQGTVQDPRHFAHLVLAFHGAVFLSQSSPEIAICRPAKGWRQRSCKETIDCAFRRGVFQLGLSKCLRFFRSSQRSFYMYRHGESPL